MGRQCRGGRMDVWRLHVLHGIIIRCSMCVVNIARQYTAATENCELHNAIINCCIHLTVVELRTLF